MLEDKSPLRLVQCSTNAHESASSWIWICNIYFRPRESKVSHPSYWSGLCPEPGTCQAGLPSAPPLCFPGLWDTVQSQQRASPVHQPPWSFSWLYLWQLACRQWSAGIVPARMHSPVNVEQLDECSSWLKEGVSWSSKDCKSLCLGRTWMSHTSKAVSEGTSLPMPLTWDPLEAAAAWDIHSHEDMSNLFSESLAKSFAMKCSSKFRSGNT